MSMPDQALQVGGQAVGRDRSAGVGLVPLGHGRAQAVGAAEAGTPARRTAGRRRCRRSTACAGPRGAGGRARPVARRGTAPRSGSGAARPGGDEVAQVVQASSIQPSAARAGLTPRPNQLWKTSCSSAGDRRGGRPVVLHAPTRTPHERPEGVAVDPRAVAGGHVAEPGLDVGLAAAQIGVDVGVAGADQPERPFAVRGG